MRTLSRSVLLAVLLLALPSAALAAPPVRVGGQSPASLTLCGAPRSAVSVAPAATVRLGVPRAATAAARRERRGAAIVVDTCKAGTWVRTSRLPIGATALPVGEARSADLRLRTRLRGGALGPAAYVRVGEGEIVDREVRFTVVNQNRTPIPCLGAPDGRSYTVSGTLVAPARVLAAPDPGVTLYLHGFGYGGFFFRFQAVPGYDYAYEQALAGHASVVVDRLGNPANGRLPDGLATCLSSQADVAAQMIAALKSGNNEGAGTFGKVVLAGHSAGGFISEVEQYSFGAADAIAVISYNDIPGPLALAQFAQAGGDCLLAPRRANGETGAPNYAPFGETEADFKAAHLHDVDPEVEAAVLRLRSLDPCGDLLNALAQLVGDEVLIRTITSPVLVISGADDALFPPPTDQLAATTGFLSSRSVAFVELPDTGHAVTLGRTHEAFRRAMSDWLTTQGV